MELKEISCEHDEALLAQNLSISHTGWLIESFLPWLQKVQTVSCIYSWLPTGSILSPEIYMLFENVPPQSRKFDKLIRMFRFWREFCGIHSFGGTYTYIFLDWCETKRFVSHRYTTVYINTGITFTHTIGSTNEKANDLWGWTEGDTRNHLECVTSWMRRFSRSNKLHFPAFSDPPPRECLNLHLERSPRHCKNVLLKRKCLARAVSLELKRACAVLRLFLQWRRPYSKCRFIHTRNRNIHTTWPANENCHPRQPNARKYSEKHCATFKIHRHILIYTHLEQKYTYYRTHERELSSHDANYNIFTLGTEIYILQNPRTRIAIPRRRTEGDTRNCTVPCFFTKQFHCDSWYERVQDKPHRFGPVGCVACLATLCVCEHTSICVVCVHIYMHS